MSHGLLKGAVIVSDDAGQFNVGHHALCWVHAERLIHKLVGFNESQRRAIERTRARVWRFYAALKTYCRDRQGLFNCCNEFVTFFPIMKQSNG